MRTAFCAIVLSVMPVAAEEDADESPPVENPTATTPLTQYYEQALQHADDDGLDSSSAELTLKLMEHTQKRRSAPPAPEGPTTADDIGSGNSVVSQTKSDDRPEDASILTTVPPAPVADRFAADQSLPELSPLSPPPFPVTTSEQILAPTSPIPMTMIHQPDTRYISSAMNEGATPCRFCGQTCGAHCRRPGHVRHGLFGLKDKLQRSHWGYCNYFHERPLGETVIEAMTRQIAHGTSDLMTLYAYDFHPLESPLNAELTSRGLYQLRKIADRIQYAPQPVKLQSVPELAELDALRVRTISEQLLEWGVVVGPEQIVPVVLIGGLPASEAREINGTLLDDVRRRGRTVSGGGSADVTFGGFSGN